MLYGKSNFQINIFIILVDDYFYNVFSLKKFLTNRVHILTLICCGPRDICHNEMKICEDIMCEWEIITNFVGSREN